MTSRAYGTRGARSPVLIMTSFATELAHRYGRKYVRMDTLPHYKDFAETSVCDVSLQ